MKDKISNFLFPVKIKKVEGDKYELILTCRFGILSVLLWNICCWVLKDD